MMPLTELLLKLLDAEHKGNARLAQSYGRLLAQSHNWRVMTKRIPSIYE